MNNTINRVREGQTETEWEEERERACVRVCEGEKKENLL